MKSIVNLILAGFFVAASTVSFAANTALDANWICTTNASTSTVDTDKAADDKMAKTAGSAVDSFAFASSNCRDCTKITCEAQASTTTTDTTSPSTTNTTDTDDND